MDDVFCKSRKGFAASIIRREMGEVLCPLPVLVGGRERGSNIDASPEYLQHDAYMLNIISIN